MELGRKRGWHHHGSDTPTSPRATNLLHSFLLEAMKLRDTLYKKVCKYVAATTF